MVRAVIFFQTFEFREFSMRIPCFSKISQLDSFFKEGRNYEANKQMVTDEEFWADNTKCVIMQFLRHISFCFMCF